MLRPNFWDCSYAYIVVIERVSGAGNSNANRSNKKVVFKNNATFRSCIWKISNTFVDSAKDLDIVMPIYNLIECSNIFLWDQEVCEIIIEMKWMMMHIKIMMLVMIG